MKDISLLVKTLREIVNSGHSVIIVEHNVQVLRNSDWILEMGPGAGANGGKSQLQAIHLPFQRRIP